MGGAAAEIDRSEAEGLIHGHEKVAGAQDAALVAEGLVEGVAERNADIFDGVVLIDVEVALAQKIEIEGSVTGEELEHVVEEADAGGYAGNGPEPSMVSFRRISVSAVLR